MNIYLYNSLLYKKIKIIIRDSVIRVNKKKLKCEICKKKLNNVYVLNNTIVFTDYDIHNYLIHGFIDIDIYDNICNLKINDFDIDFILLHTNNSNIIDGLYEEGSNKIYIEHNKNINNFKIQRYSEHFGFIIEKSYKIEKINVVSNYKVDKNDPDIYFPENNIETFDMKYIFHTHPRSKEYGSRDNYIKIYEFPSLNDIIHFIDHHNLGKLIGSLVITPEGIYNIRKYNFNKNKIKIDMRIFIKKMKNIIYDLEDKIDNKFIDLFNKNDIKKYFYKYISTNIEFIKIINEELEKYDIAIDYYSRILFKNTDKYLFPNIYLPII